MGTISYTIPQAASTLNSVADPEIATALQTLLTFANGGIDGTNIAAALAQSAGVNQSGQTVKGAVNIAASESRTNVAYGTMPTPDQVTGIVLPTNGLIQVWYQATWQESVNAAARAAIFVGVNQLQIGPGGNTASPAVQECSVGSSGTGVNRILTSQVIGLTGSGGSGTVAYTGDVTTGQVVGMNSNGAGGPCYIFAAAGTYSIAVMFKASSGSVTVSNRKLWVQALSFA